MESPRERTRTTSDDPSGSGARRGLELLRIQKEIQDGGSFTNIVLEGVPGGVVIVSVTGEILQANEEATRVLGLTRDELANRWIADFSSETFHEDGSPCPAEEYPVSKCLATGTQQPPLTLGVRRTGHDTTWAVYRATPLRSKSDALLGAVVTFLDLTGRMRAEEALRGSEERLRTVLETSPDHIFTVDEQARILYINRVAPEHEGQDLLGQSCYAFVPGEGKQLLEEALRLAFTDGLPSRYEIQTNFGRTYVSRVAPLRPDADGGKRALLLATDVSDQRAAAEERKLLEDRVQETQRLESMALLAGGVAHDFNNLLVGVLGHLELALREGSDAEDTRAHLSEAHTVAMRAAELTNQLLAYSGKGKFVVEPLDVNSLIQDMAGLLGASPTRKLDLELEFAEGLPGVEGDATQLRQVIMNLVTNAAEAMNDRPGGLVLRTALATPEQVSAARFPPESPHTARYVAVEVIDRGPGIDPALVTKIFDPFFSTKFTGRGLGLAAARGIIRGHHGGLDVVSTQGEGSVFRLFLPALTAPVTGTSGPGRVLPAKPTPRTGTVLIADDEEHIRLVASLVLKESGFDVLTAKDGAEAIEIYRAHKDEIDVILLDLLMPNMDGEQALDGLRKITPDVRVVLTSGYGEEVATSSLDSGLLAGFIKKPYRIDDLLDAIQRALPVKP